MLECKRELLSYNFCCFSGISSLLPQPFYKKLYSKSVDAVSDEHINTLFKGKFQSIPEAYGYLSYEELLVISQIMGNVYGMMEMISGQDSPEALRGKVNLLTEQLDRATKPRVKQEDQQKPVNREEAVKRQETKPLFTERLLSFEEFKVQKLKESPIKSKEAYMHELGEYAYLADDLSIPTEADINSYLMGKYQNYLGGRHIEDISLSGAGLHGHIFAKELISLKERAKANPFVPDKFIEKLFDVASNIMGAVAEGGIEVLDFAIDQNLGPGTSVEIKGYLKEKLTPYAVAIEHYARDLTPETREAFKDGLKMSDAIAVGSIIKSVATIGVDGVISAVPRLAKAVDNLIPVGIAVTPEGMAVGFIDDITKARTKNPNALFSVADDVRPKAKGRDIKAIPVDKTDKAFGTNIVEDYQKAVKAIDAATARELAEKRATLKWYKEEGAFDEASFKAHDKLLVEIAEETRAVRLATMGSLDAEVAKDMAERIVLDRHAKIREARMLDAMAKEQASQVGTTIDAATSIKPTSVQETAIFGTKIDAAIKFTPELKAKIIDTISKGNIDDIARVFDQELNWNLREALNKVPNHLWKEAGIKPASSLFNPKDPVLGIRFITKSDDIRIMKGDLKAEWPTQHQDYVKIVSGGKTGLRDGTFISSKEMPEVSLGALPEAHIPLQEWIKWSKWNEK